MNVTGWRLCHRMFAAEAFSGVGAALAGQRWNRRGERAVYCAEHLSLAALEVMVHLDSPADLELYVFASITCAAEAIVDIDQRLAARIRGGETIDIAETQRAGSAAFASGALGFRAPSFVVPLEHTIVLNPAHPMFAGLHRSRPAAFPLDARLARLTRVGARSEVGGG